MELELNIVILVSIVLSSPLHLYRHIWACSSDSLTTASSTSSSVILKAIVMAATCPGMAPHIIADGDPEAVQGKPIGEQGDEGSSGTSCMSSKQERYCAWPSSPRLDGGRSKLTLQSQYIFSDRPALGWTVSVCNAPVLKAKWILHMRRLLLAHKHSCLALPIPSIPFSFLESWIVYSVSISSSFVLLTAWYGADGNVGENAFCRRRSFFLFPIPLTQIGEREASPWKPRRVLSGRRQKEANGKVFVLK